MSGTVYCWGLDVEGQLGIQDKNGKDLKGKHKNSKSVMLPTKSKVAKGFKSINLFGNYSYAIKANGDVYSWGSNSRGKLGHDPSLENVEIPAKVLSLKAIKQIDCGLWHVLALDLNGVVFSCGSNKSGELGREGTGEGF